MTAPKAEHDRIFQHWREQLVKIERELFHGFLYQVVWSELRDEIQRRHPEADGTFLVSYSSGYVAGQMLLVRRLTDKAPSSDSLVSLINRILRQPDIVTRTRYAEQWAANVEAPMERWTGELAWDESFTDPMERWTAELAWDESFADPHDPERLNVTLLEQDLDRLETELEHIVTWATKTIAHLDPTQPERVPKYHEVREALDVLAEVTGRYQSLLNQSVTAEWTPAIQGDWQAPFRPSLFPLDFDAYWPPLGGFT
jgi:hypothetical protein